MDDGTPTVYPTYLLPGKKQLRIWPVRPVLTVWVTEHSLPGRREIGNVRARFREVKRDHDSSIHHEGDDICPTDAEGYGDMTVLMMVVRRGSTEKKRIKSPSSQG